MPMCDLRVQHRLFCPSTSSTAFLSQHCCSDQGRATATISSRFGCMELSCHHQRTLSPCFKLPLPAPGLGKIQGARPAGILDTHRIARLNYATICNSAAWSLQFLQKPAANLDAQAVSPLQWPSHVAMLLGNNAFSSFALCLRPLPPKNMCIERLNCTGTTRTCNPMFWPMTSQYNGGGMQHNRRGASKVFRTVRLLPLM